jgi:hypothetical protein
MVRIDMEIYCAGDPIRVSARASSIRRAEDIVRSRYPGSEVRVVFPIDGNGFFDEDGGQEGIEAEGLGLATG